MLLFERYIYLIGLIIGYNGIYIFVGWYSIIDKYHNDRWECVAIVSWIYYL